MLDILILKGKGKEEIVPGIQQKYLYGKAPQTQPTRAVLLNTAIQTLCSNTGREDHKNNAKAFSSHPLNIFPGPLIVKKRTLQLDFSESPPLHRAGWKEKRWRRNEKKNRKRDKEEWKKMKKQSGPRLGLLATKKYRKRSQQKLCNNLG